MALRTIFAPDDMPIFYWNNQATPVRSIVVPKKQSSCEAFINCSNSYYQVIFDSDRISKIYIGRQNTDVIMFGWCDGHIMYMESYLYGGFTFIIDEILPNSVVFRSSHAPHEITTDVLYNRDEVVFLNNMLNTPLLKQQNKHIWGIIQRMIYTATKTKSTAK